MADEKEPPHTHDYNGKTQPGGVQQVGNELVTYREIYCTCGHHMQNLVVRRERTDN